MHKQIYRNPVVGASNYLASISLSHELLEMPFLLLLIVSFHLNQGMHKPCGTGGA